MNAAALRRLIRNAAAISAPAAASAAAKVPYGANKTYNVSRLCGGWKPKLDLCSNACRPGVMRCCDVSVEDHGCDPGQLDEETYRARRSALAEMRGEGNVGQDR